MAKTVKVPTCSPKMWVVAKGNNLTYGWKCPFHHEHGKRYASEALRDQRMQEHVDAHLAKVPKKS